MPTQLTDNEPINVPELGMTQVDPYAAIREVYQAYPSVANQHLPRLADEQSLTTVNNMAEQYLPVGQRFNWSGPWGFADVNQRLLGTPPKISLGPEVTWSRAQDDGINPFKSNVYFDAPLASGTVSIDDIISSIPVNVGSTVDTGGTLGGTGGTTGGTVGGGGGTSAGGGLLPWEKPNWIPDDSEVTSTGYIIKPGNSPKFPGGAIVVKVDGGWTITDSDNPTDDPIFVNDVPGGGPTWIPTGTGTSGEEWSNDWKAGGGGGIDTGVGGGFTPSVGGGAYDFTGGGGYHSGGSGLIVVDDPNKGPSTLEQMMGMRWDRDFIEGGDLAGDRGRTVGGGRGKTSGPSTYEEWLNFRRDPDVQLQTKGEKLFEEIMQLGNEYLGPTRFDAGELHGDKGMFIRGMGKLRDWFLGLSDERLKAWEDKGIPSELTGRNPFGPDYVDAIRNIRDILQNKDGIKVQEYGDLQVPGLLFAAGLISQYGSQVGLPLAAINMSNDIMSATNNMFAKSPEFAGNPIQDVIHTAFWVPAKIGKEAWNATIGKVLPKIQDTTLKDKLNNLTLGKLRNPPKSSPRIRVSIKGKEVGLGQPLQTKDPTGITGEVTPLPKPPRITKPLGQPPVGREIIPEGTSKTRPIRGQGQLLPEFKGYPAPNIGSDPRDRTRGKDHEDIGDRPTVGSYDYITPLPDTPRDPSDPKPSDPRDPGHPNVSDPNVPAGDTPKGKYSIEYTNVPVDANGFPFGTDQFDESNYFGETAPNATMHFTELGKDNPNAGAEQADWEQRWETFKGREQWLVEENTARNAPPDTTDVGGRPGQIKGSDGKYYDPNPGGWKDPYNKGLGLIDQFDSSTWDWNQSWDDSIRDGIRNLLPSTHPQHKSNEPADTDTDFDPLDDDTNVWGGAGGGTKKPDDRPKFHELTSDDAKFIASSQFIPMNVTVTYTNTHPDYAGNRTVRVSVPLEPVLAGTTWKAFYDVNNYKPGNFEQWNDWVVDSQPMYQGTTIDVSKHVSD